MGLSWGIKFCGIGWPKNIWGFRDQNRKSYEKKKKYRGDEMPLGQIDAICGMIQDYEN